MPLGGACDLYLDSEALSEAEEEHSRGERAFFLFFFSPVFSTAQALWRHSIIDQM